MLGGVDLKISAVLSQPCQQNSHRFYLRNNWACFLDISVVLALCSLSDVVQLLLADEFFNVILLLLMFQSNHSVNRNAYFKVCAMVALNFKALCSWTGLLIWAGYKQLVQRFLAQYSKPGLTSGTLSLLGQMCSKGLLDVSSTSTTLPDNNFFYFIPKTRLL